MRFSASKRHCSPCRQHSSRHSRATDASGEVAQQIQEKQRCIDPGRRPSVGVLPSRRVCGLQQTRPTRAAASITALQALETECSSETMSSSMTALQLELEDLADRQPLHLKPVKPGSAQRIMVMTDIHADKEENMHWLKELKHREGSFSNDVIILCGDVADTMDAMRQALQTLVSTFGHVFYIPGNHDIWLRGNEVKDYSDSIQKLVEILRLCKGLGVRVMPSEVGGLWIAPLWSWHHASFDKEPDVEDALRGSLSRYITDYTACKWPTTLPGAAMNGCITTAEWFDKINNIAEARLASRNECEPLISFSHFLPLQQLLPEKRFLYFQCLAKAAGSDPLAIRVRKLAPDLHCFGHTHFSWDQEVDGIRYLQAPLCYPKERIRRPKTVSFRSTDDTNEDNTVSMAASAEWLPLEICSCSSQSQEPSNTFGSSEMNGSSSDHNDSILDKDEENGRRRQHHFAPKLSAPWSDYYSTTDRDPDNTEPAPWVAERLQRSKIRRQKAGADNSAGGSS